MKRYDKNKCSSDLFKGYSGCCCDYCRKYSSQKSKWIVNIKGKPTSRIHEISIVRETNRHGIASYGWPDNNKIILSSSTNHSIPEEAFNYLVVTAKKLANKYNKKEGSIIL